MGYNQFLKVPGYISPGKKTKINYERRTYMKKISQNKRILIACITVTIFSLFASLYIGDFSYDSFAIFVISFMSGIAIREYTTRWKQKSKEKS